MAERPRYSIFDSPALADLNALARMQIIQAINCQVIVELVDLAGGEVVLAAGFKDRIKRPAQMLETRFLDDGGYRLRAIPLEEEHYGPAIGSMWTRHDVSNGVKPGTERWIVIDGYKGDEYVTLARVSDDGDLLENVPVVRVKQDYCRRRIGWQPWFPPEADIEDLTGDPS